MKRFTSPFPASDFLPPFANNASTHTFSFPSAPPGKRKFPVPFPERLLIFFLSDPAGLFVEIPPWTTSSSATSFHELLFD
jgi:hypothetical protein